MVGSTVRPYKVLQLLGQVELGVVYKAQDTRLGRMVAINVLLDGTPVAPAEAEARLLREARVPSSLNHPHLCTLHDIGQEDGRRYLVLEVLDGRTLGECIRAGIDRARQIAWGMQIASALQEAHSRAIVHRDLKP